MLSAGDDYPLHQRPEPVAFAGSDRNFYDRYYFQGYLPQQGMCFGAALGVYPHLNLADAAFMLQRGGQQHSVLASRHLNGNRMDTRVGPVEVQVLEPLHRLRVVVNDPAHNCAVDLTFTGRAAPVQEPRFTYRVGAMTVLDLTRMTQGGTWQGQIQLDGEVLTVEDWRGARDRSWGVRPLGARDTRAHGYQGQPPQWYWLWAPLHFDTGMLFFHTNDDAEGQAWNRSAVWVPANGSPHWVLQDVQHHPRYRPGTRQVSRCTVTGRLPDGSRLSAELRCGEVVYKQGEGYNHPTWGHGMHHGPSASTREFRDTRSLDPNDFAQVHLHALCEATLQVAGRPWLQGEGVLEQMIVGPHGPSGFRGLDDVSPA